MLWRSEDWWLSSSSCTSQVVVEIFKMILELTNGVFVWREYVVEESTDLEQHMVRLGSTGWGSNIIKANFVVYTSILLVYMFC